MVQVTSPGEFQDIKAVGPVAQFFPVPTPAFPATLDPAGGAAPSWTSDIILSDGFKALSVGATLSRSGTLSITRYIDLGGQVALKTDTVNLTASTASVLTITDGLPFGSYQVAIANTDGTSGHTAVISNFALAMNAA